MTTATKVAHNGAAATNAAFSLVAEAAAGGLAQTSTVAEDSSPRPPWASSPRPARRRSFCPAVSPRRSRGRRTDGVDVISGSSDSSSSCRWCWPMRSHVDWVGEVTAATPTPSANSSPCPRRRARGAAPTLTRPVAPPVKGPRAHSPGLADSVRKRHRIGGAMGAAASHRCVTGVRSRRGHRRCAPPRLDEVSTSGVSQGGVGSPCGPGRGSVQPPPDVRLHQAGADPAGGAGHRHTGRPGQHRTQLEVGHLRQVVRESREPQGQVDEGFAGDHPRAPVAVQQRCGARAPR